MAMVFVSLFAPAVGNAQEIYRATRSPEEQRAISQIGQAEYYARMALRSLEASEKLGKAPYFDHQSAREDIGKVLDEFKIYLKGDESTDLPPAVPLIVDGRYFSESIKSSLASLKAEKLGLQTIYRRRTPLRAQRQPRRRPKAQRRLRLEQHRIRK